MAGTNRKFSGCGFHHVALRASDFDKSLLFYTEGMGFPVVGLSFKAAIPECQEP